MNSTQTRGGVRPANNMLTENRCAECKNILANRTECACCGVPVCQECASDGGHTCPDDVGDKCYTN